MISVVSVYRVWYRYFASFKKNVVYAMVTTFVEPMLYLLSFGFGLGSMVGDVDIGGQRMGYRAFVLAGVVGQTLLFQGFFEAAYGSFVRMYYQRIFQAVAVTPVTLLEVLWGELIWDSSKATVSAAAVLMMGVALGDFSLLGALVLIPFCFLFAMLFAAVGLFVAAKSRTIESISYPQYLFVFPMFLFCGVFFPLSSLPAAVQTAVWALPLTSVLSFVRSLTLGIGFSWWAILIAALWLVIFIPISLKAMMKRILA